MIQIEIKFIKSFQSDLKKLDPKTNKLIQKQKEFMNRDYNHNSLGRKKLRNVKDKFGNEIWEIRLDKKRRIVFVEKVNNGSVEIIWLKICSHDELARKNVLRVKGDY